MADASWPLQKAIFDAVNGLGGISAYDSVPAGLPFPFYVVGDDTAVEDIDKSTDGQIFAAQVHAWSRYNGQKQAKEMIEAVRGALHMQPLAVTGFHHIDTIAEFQEVIADPEPHTYHGVIRFRIQLSDN